MKIILIHGFAATIQSNWFPWIEKKVNHELGISVQAISLPNSIKPNLHEWIESLNEEVSDPDETTLFIAHSLGCITLLKYIERLPTNVIIGGIILISAFDERIPLIPLINPFVEKKPDYAVITSKVKNIKVVSSTNDVIVPSKYTKKVAKELQTTLIEIPKAGHFTTQDGYTSFPELYSLVITILNSL